MIEPFTGTYLFHPAALEISGNTCSHKCCYCFANANKPARYAKLKSVINQLHKDTCKTYTDTLLNMGHAICISNKTDPFSLTNYRDTIALFQHLQGHGNGVFIQTKGGTGIDDVLSIVGDRRDVVWYITLTSIDDDITKRIEPGAPIASERLALAEKLHDLGFHVIIAVNPCVESWMPMTDLIKLTEILKSMGIHHVCLEILHLSRKTLKSMTAEQANQFGQSVIDTVNKPENKQYTRDCTEYLHSQGMSIAKKGMPFRSTFFDDMREYLPVTLPVIQDFINYCFDRDYSKGLTLTFDDFKLVMATDKLYSRTFTSNDCRGYLLRQSFDVWKENQRVDGHEQLLKLFWNDKRLKNSIQHHCLFKVAEGVDSDGNIKLYFDGKPNLS